jgi:cell division protein FtsL
MKFLIYFVYFILFAIAVALFMIAYPTYKKNNQAKAENIAINKKAIEVHQENEKLNAEVRGLQNSKEAIERVAREKFKLAKPGEIIYRYDDKPKDEESLPTSKDR